MAAFLMLFVAFVIILIQATAPRPEWIDLGNVDEFSDSPVLRQVMLPDKPRLFVWIVHTGNRWLAFDHQAPFGSRCLYQLQDSTQRFEDPCSGAKFALTGEYLDVYTYLKGETVQDLDRYPVSMRGDHVFINSFQVIHAKPYIARVPTAECCGP